MLKNNLRNLYFIKEQIKKVKTKWCVQEVIQDLEVVLDLHQSPLTSREDIVKRKKHLKHQIATENIDHVQRIEKSPIKSNKSKRILK